MVEKREVVDIPHELEGAGRVGQWRCMKNSPSRDPQCLDDIRNTWGTYLKC